MYSFHKNNSTLYDRCDQNLELLRDYWNESSNINEFKSCYTQKIREDKTQNNWQKNIDEAKISMKRKFGAIDLKDFTFKFNKKESKLGVFFKKKLAFWTRVASENGEWKIAQR